MVAGRPSRDAQAMTDTTHPELDLRKLMGATDPAKAEDGTIRKKHAASIEANSIHGSDAEDTARFELSYFFAGYELTK